MILATRNHNIASCILPITGLVVLCSPVDQTSSMDSFDSDTTKTKVDDRDSTSTNNTNPKIENGNDKSMETKPVAPRPHPPLKKQISFEKDEPMPKPLSRDVSTSSSEKSMDDKNSDFGISIKQVEFYSINETHCSTQDINPLRVTVPSHDTVLISGLQDSVQLLVHNREGPPMVPEPMHSRVFYSHHEMDVAVVAALVSARNSFKSTNQTVVEKPENFSKLLDKYKPVKKRSLTDLTTNLKKEDYEMPSRKKFASLDVPDTGTPKIKLPTQNSLPASATITYDSQSNTIPQSLIRPSNRSPNRPPFQRSNEIKQPYSNCFLKIKTEPSSHH